MLAPTIHRGTLGLLLVLLAAALTACALPRRAQARPPGSSAPVRYRVEIPAPHRQYVHVAMDVTSPSGRHAQVAMPAWTPGSYLIRDFARHVYDLRAEDDRGRALETRRLDKQTWRVEHGGRPFTVRYRVFAAEPSVRTSHVDDQHASLVGASLFLYVMGEQSRPSEVEVMLPAGWSAHTALAADPTASDGVVRLTAPDYDTLVDSPIELGTPAVERFEVDGAQIEYVLTGAEGTAIELRRLVDDARRVVEAQGELMGGLPFSRYVFLLRVSEVGGGGLEHASSTSMMMRRADFDRDDGYARAARLAAHELFHAWNVKRIHDRALGPFDYGRENHSRLLWLHEGFTETMEAQSLLRAGLVEPHDYVRELGQRFSSYLGKPGRNYAPLSSLSFDAWTKAYMPADNHPNVAISYYEKGDFVGIALDLELRLRAASHGHEGSLAGLFRRLMASHGAKGRGISADDVVAATSAEAGEDMAWFFARYVDGTEELPLPELLPRVGVDVKISAPWLDDDGKVLDVLGRTQRLERLHTGLQLSGNAEVRNVEPDSPADRAGLMLHDVVVAVDGLRTSTRSAVEARLADHVPGESVRIALFRGERLLERTLTVAESTARTIALSLRPQAELSAEQQRLRQAWLGGE
ncbi:M61 family metallopeptidase [Paraliomyxa miuraensis]|uniref:M61 family metallopeptidase n=1 Tax=Paraliomyxa miuraensis TaxID=376150 RepID=UPI0022541DDD|nr:PDZ domain-containing protein [Paraliomyxa miuraensis]MCX4245056.1 PDZ domain-containing protein [Paraliomyxa miuraensis]